VRRGSRSRKSLQTQLYGAGLLWNGGGGSLNRGGKGNCAVNKCDPAKLEELAKDLWKSLGRGIRAESPVSSPRSTETSLRYGGGEADRDLGKTAVET